jgi:uncharacterized membrane protein
MDPDAADITPAGRQPNRSKKEAESAPLDAQSQIDSIVLNAPVADVYAYCSRFEELPRFMTSLRDVQKIDETHFSFTSLLDGEEHTTVLQIVLRIPEGRIAWQANVGQFSAWRRLVRAPLQSDDRDYRKIAIEHRVSNAR